MTLEIFFIIIGRVLVGALFLIAGIRNVLAFDERIRGKTNYGWALPPPVVGLGFAVEILGGASVVLGLWPEIGAAGLIVFTVLATALYHNFTLFPAPERNTHFYFVTVNAALCGALLMIIATA